MSILIVEKKIAIEKQIDIALKQRKEYFKDLEREQTCTYSWRKQNALVVWNTKKIARLREEWREVNRGH